MNAPLNNTPNESIDMTLDERSLEHDLRIERRNREFNRFYRGALITGMISLAITLLVCKFLCRPQNQEFNATITVMIFTVGLPILMLFGMIPYGLVSLLLKHSKSRFLYRLRIIVGLSPIWGFAILTIVSCCNDHIYGAENALAFTTENTVSMKEVKDFRDCIPRIALKCSYEMVYFRTTPEVVDRLLKLHDYKKEWPFDEDYFADKPELAQKEFHERFMSRLSIPKDWPDPWQWDGPEVFHFSQDLDYPEGCSTGNYLVTDKARRQVIVERHRICP